MNKINNLLETLATPFKPIAHWALRLGLGISFFLHGYGKVPISEGFVNWLTSKGVSAASIVAPLVAWGEILAGLGIIIGGLIASRMEILASVITRLSGGAIVVIMIGALLIAHSDWSFFIGERGSILFASEQLFLLLLGAYFAIRGNE
ncbi:MAG: DoxX family protein [Gammaproteobacteria bacterium]